MALNVWTHLAVTRDSNNLVKVFVGTQTTERISFTKAGTFNPYTTDFDATYNCGLWIGNSGQHGRYRWNGQIAECRLTKSYTDIVPLLPVTDVFTDAYRNDLRSSTANFSSFDGNTTAANVFDTTSTRIWVSSVVSANSDGWQRLYVLLKQDVTLTRVRITNITAAEGITTTGAGGITNTVLGPSSVQVLVKTTDPLWDTSFVNDIVYENNSLSNTTTSPFGGFFGCSQEAAVITGVQCHHCGAWQVHYLRFPASFQPDEPTTCHPGRPASPGQLPGGAADRIFGDIIAGHSITNRATFAVYIVVLC